MGPVKAKGWSNAVAAPTAGPPTPAIADADRPFRTDLDCDRGQELRDIGVKLLIGGTQLGQHKTREPGLVAAVDENVVAAQQAMGESVLAELPDAVPQIGESDVRNLFRGKEIQSAPTDVHPGDECALRTAALYG